jgi:hypothetical protein
MYSIIKTDITSDKDWQNFLKAEHNLFYDWNFLSYNDRFGKNIHWHHLKVVDDSRNTVIALLTGCEVIQNNNKTFISCNGVSFGGFLWKDRLDLIIFMNVLNSFKDYLKKNNFKNCILRNPPHVYTKNFNEEYEFALLQMDFKITKTSITNIIRLNEFEFEKLPNPKKRSIKKSERNIKINELSDTDDKSTFEKCYEVLYRNRELKNVKPTHTLDELIYLKNTLKDRIKIFYASIENDIVALCILFIIKKDVILNFYLATDDDFRKERVSEFILYKSIQWGKDNNFRLYDIGTSNIGDVLLEGLFAFKKKFLANGFLRNTFELDTRSKAKIKS